MNLQIWVNLFGENMARISPALLIHPRTLNRRPQIVKYSGTLYTHEKSQIIDLVLNVKEGWKALPDAFQSTTSTICKFGISACDLNCLNCDTNGRDKCDSGQCKARYAFDSTTKTCLRELCLLLYHVLLLK